MWYHRNENILVGGAIAGGMIFGPLGAVMGGGSSLRTISNRSKFLVFTYMPDRENETETQYILFNVTGKGIEAGKFARKFRRLKQNPNIRIDL